MSSSWDADVVIVGSGYGGAVTAARLAEAGQRVLVLERGRRWRPEEYPRKPGDAWFFDAKAPHRQNGWLDLRHFGEMSVAMGAGVGGGSLLSGNVSIIPPASTFASNWPRAITHEGLLPFYEKAGQVMHVREVPENQLPPRYYAVQNGARALGAGDRFRRVPLAVSFSEEFTYHQRNPFAPDKSIKFTNAHGKEQGSCNHCGECCMGCKQQAKNTLDLNYLAIAEKHGAEIRPLHLVYGVRPWEEGEGYEVLFNRVVNGELVPGLVRARRVVLSAGSLGSTEILLRSRDELRSLPRVSQALGRGWSSNGDYLTYSVHSDMMIPTRGPTSSCAIDYLDGGYEGASLFIGDGAMGEAPHAWLGMALRQSRQWLSADWYSRTASHLLHWLRTRHARPHVIAWFAQSVDASNGHIELHQPWYAPWRRELSIDWNMQRSGKTQAAVTRLHTALARANNAEAVFTPPTRAALRELTTPHPLGGCRMADSPSQGVVDHRGEVYGYPGLYVADGSIIPTALGINPSRTIAALAERNAGLMVGEG